MSVSHLYSAEGAEYEQLWKLIRYFLSVLLQSHTNCSISLETTQKRRKAKYASTLQLWVRSWGLDVFISEVYLKLKLGYHPGLNPNTHTLLLQELWNSMKSLLRDHFWYLNAWMMQEE